MPKEKKKQGRPSTKINPEEKAESLDSGITPPEEKAEKTLNNVDMETLRKNVSDVELFGNADKWLCIAKCWSKHEGWMKSTKGMNIPGYGCLIQVLEQYDTQTTTSITAIQGVGVYPSKYGGYRLVGHLQKNEPEE